jgi:hypothetical protein
MGIAQRNLRDLERRAKAESQADSPTEVELAIDELERIFAKVYPDDDLQEIISILLTHDRLTEADDAAITAEDGEAVIDSWLATLAGLVHEHGSLAAASEWQRAEDHRRLEEQLAKNAAVRDAAIASARQAQLDDEVKGLLLAAERFLRESSDA